MYRTRDQEGPLPCKRGTRSTSKRLGIDTLANSEQHWRDIFGLTTSKQCFLSYKTYVSFPEEEEEEKTDPDALPIVDKGC